LAKKRGAKIVVLDPRLSESAAIADILVPLKPGTDLAFLLAIGHVLIKRGLYDDYFLKKYTNAPMLLDTNTGTPVKVWTDENTGKKRYLVYDAQQDRVSPHDSAADPALTGEFDIGSRGRFLSQSKASVPSYDGETGELLTRLGCQDMRHSR